jgi:serine/threonine protein kinase
MGKSEYEQEVKWGESWECIFAASLGATRWTGSLEFFGQSYTLSLEFGQVALIIMFYFPLSFLFEFLFQFMDEMLAVDRQAAAPIVAEEAAIVARQAAAIVARQAADELLLQRGENWLREQVRTATAQRNAMAREQKQLLLDQVKAEARQREAEDRQQAAAVQRQRKRDHENSLREKERERQEQKLEEERRRIAEAQSRQKEQIERQAQQEKERLQQVQRCQEKVRQEKSERLRKQREAEVEERKARQSVKDKELRKQKLAKDKQTREQAEVETKKTMAATLRAAQAVCDSEQAETVGSLTVFIGSVLGEGSEGTKVYKGRHDDGRIVAVKVMVLKKGDDVRRKRALREMQLLQSLSESTGLGRAGVIEYRCIEQTEDRMFLGMELCECSLHDIVQVQKVQIPFAHQIRILRELCHAVAFLHEQQIVHRDVRPKNILFKQGGFKGTLKLSDFGLSKAVDTDNQDKTFTTTHARSEIGTFGFYSRESILHSKITMKADVFSAGCCIFYLLSHGYRPHDDPEHSNNKYATNANVIAGKSDLNLDVKHQKLRNFPAVRDLVGAMLDIEAANRPSMSQALQHIVFWDTEHRFQFLHDVGNDGDVAASNRNAKDALPSIIRVLQTSNWARKLDDTVWKLQTTGEHAREYDTASLPQLLRFLRNSGEHLPPHGSVAAEVFIAHGGMAAYFDECFPQLAFEVWIALKHAGWEQRLGLQKHFTSVLFPISGREGAEAGAEAGAIVMAVDTAAAGAGAGNAGGGGEERIPIKQWLVSVSPLLETYAAAFTEYGYEDMSMLIDATTEDIESTVDELKMKRGHRRALLNAFAVLQQAAPRMAAAARIAAQAAAFARQAAGPGPIRASV